MPINLDQIKQYTSSLTGASQNTRDAYYYALKAFADADIPLDNDALKTFDQHLTHRRYSKQTRNLYVTALKVYLNWLDANDQLPAELSRAKAEARLKVQRGSRERTGYKPRIADPQLPEIIFYYDRQPDYDLNQPKNHRRQLELLRSRAIMHVLYATGARVSEVATLTRAQVADGRISEIMIVGKGNKQRMIFLTPEAQTAIRRYCESRTDTFAPLFISHRRGLGKPLTRMSVWKAVKHAAKMCGLSKITSPHSFRHWQATRLLNEGMPLESVQMFLGHASNQTTRMIYAHTETRTLRDQLDTYRLKPDEAIKSLKK